MGSDEPEQYRKLFIGGLKYTTTNDSLKEFFEQWGEIEYAIVIKDPQTKRSKGFGFITYSQSFMVDQAMSNRPHKIDGREVETKRAVSHDDIDKPEITATVKKIFVSGLKELSDNDILEYFGKFGKITYVSIPTDKDSGQRKGFGFITYSQSFMVDQAMSNRPHKIDGREVETKRAVSHDDIDKPEITATVKKIFVSGLKELSDNDILEYFGKFGKITYVSIPTDKDSGQRKGFGFIEYDDTDSVDKAVSIKSHQVAGIKLNVQKSISRSDGAGGGRGGRGGRGGIGGDSGGSRSSWVGNHRNELWGGHHNRSNGGGGGYGNSGMGGGYGSGRGGSAGGYNSNSGGAWQGGGGAPQIWGNNNPACGNQISGGNSRGDSQQCSNNWGPNQMYGGGGPMRSYYTSNYRNTPYGHPGASNVNAGNAGYGQNPGQPY